MSEGNDSLINQREEIAKTIDLFFTEQSYREVRAFNVYMNDFEPRAGLFALANDRDYLIEQVLEWDAREAKGVYFTLNPVDLTKVDHQIQPNMQHVMYQGLPATDETMLRREWILIDVDPTRASGISATDSEHELALITAKRIYKYLRNMGWPSAILADSGNGYHLLYKTLPEPEIETYLSKALRTLECLFNTDSVEVDIKVYNPSRITRFYGTYARKGEPTLDRPHRCSHFGYIPETIVPLTAKHIAELANLYPEKEEGNVAGGTNIDERFTQLDLWIRKSGLVVRGPRPWQKSGRKWILSTCPFNPEHVDDSAYILQFPNGAIAAGCLHNSCKHNSWETLTQKFGPLKSLAAVPKEINAELSLGDRGESFHPLPPEIDTQKPLVAGRFALTDMGNASRFNFLFGATTRYINAERRWLTWNGYYWVPDDEAGIDYRCKQVAEAIKREGLNATSKTIAQQTFAWGTKSQSAGALAAMKTLVKSEVPIACSPNIWDSNPWLFNMKNGTFRLDQDEFSTPNMDDYCSKVSGVSYDSEAKAPKWEEFLSDIMGGNAEKIAYLQRMAGYCLTGSVKEQVIFFFIGTGRNGKSTFLEILRYILGSYAKVGAPDLLTTTRVGESKHPAGIADMVGARLVICSEADKGSYLSEATVKMITGEEALKARHMGKDWFTFQATQKIVVLANHKPIVRGTDNGIWRRIHVVPFDVVIPEDKQDRDLTLKLKREAAGIFNWMLEGFRKYRADGLRPPVEVQQAVKDYRESMDILADFLTEECVVDKKAECLLADLYNSYSMFCAGRQERAISNKAFSSSLAERGYRKDRNSKGTFFYGINLKGH